jgi:GxxExxY protein
LLAVPSIAFIVDIIVEEKLILELKSVVSIERIHQKQLATYLKLLNMKKGLILNFNSSLMTDVISQVSF